MGCAAYWTLQLLSARAQIIRDTHLVVDGTLVWIPDDHGPAPVDLILLPLLRRRIVRRGNPPQRHRQHPPVGQFHMHGLIVKPHLVDAGLTGKRLGRYSRPVR